MQSGIFKRVFPYLKMLTRYRISFALGLLCSVAYGALSGFGLPLMVTYGFPIIFKDPRPELAVLVGVIAVFPVVMMLRGITNYFSIYLMNYCGVHLLASIRMRIQEKLQSIPLAFFHRNTNGDIMSRALNDTHLLQSMIIEISIDMIKQPVQLIGALSALIVLSFKQKELLFLLLFVALIPVVIVPLRYIGKRLLKRSTQLQDTIGDLSHIVTENISAAREVRAFNLEQRELGRVREALKRFCVYNMKTVKYGNIMRPGIEVVGAFGIAAAIGYFVVSDIRPGEVAGLFVAFWATYEPMKKVGEVYNKFKRADAFLTRIEHITEEVDTIPDPDQPAALAPVTGDIALRDVRFRYLDEWVLNGISLRVAAGTTVALVGPSGAGKSTLADLIPRFYDVSEGAIEIDGKDVRAISKAELRGAISVVSQDTFLFNESIMENIRLGRPGATDEQIHEAARQAFAHEFILELEEGYDTVVGDRGTRLSGGQKQRIAIARAFLKASPILILDEATSALDSESEEMIQQSIERLVEGRTVIVIAHRFSTIRNADKIVVLDAGNMVGFGSHDELYPGNEMYKRLYDRQFAD